MTRIKLAIAALLVLLLPLHALAHPGKTDSQGGHTDRSTGEYHYHHGYPAHSHTNGKCPYDFRDKTGQNSGSSSYSSYNSVTPAPTKAPSRTKTNDTPTDYTDIALGAGGGITVYSIFRSIAKSKEKRP